MVPSWEAWNAVLCFIVALTDAPRCRVSPLFRPSVRILLSELNCLVGS